MNVPGESTLRREFLRLQQENKSNSEALKQQQQQLQQQQQQQRDPEAHIKHLLHQRQRRIEEQKEERRRVEEVGLFWGGACEGLGAGLVPLGQRGGEGAAEASSPFVHACRERLCPVRDPAPGALYPHKPCVLPFRTEPFLKSCTGSLQTGLSLSLFLHRDLHSRFIQPH